MSAADFDIAIAGGGLVGATLACALAPLGYRVAVVEAVSPRAAAQPSYDDRTLALSHASCRILEGLGLWSGLREDATPIREVVVTELGRPGRVSLKPEELGLDRFGHVVEARVFGREVMAQLADRQGIELICPARVTGLSNDQDQVALTIDAEGEARRLTAALLVAADGAQSTVREMLGIEARCKDYGQTAVICNVTPETFHAGRAFERMTPTGPFALLPHRGERCGLVWCVTNAEAVRVMDLSAEDFLQEATARSGRVLGALRQMGQRSSYPLRLTVTDQDVAQRAIVLGNAAHAIHPAGAQGFNLGLRDVAVLAEVLVSRASDGRPPDPGAKHFLQAYADWRRSDREQTVAWTDGLVSLFSSPYQLSGMIRTLGMLTHSIVPPLRRRLASAAMGYRGRIPRLAMGEPLVPVVGSES